FLHTSTTVSYTLSLHDALPIYAEEEGERRCVVEHADQQLLLVIMPERAPVGAGPDWVGDGAVLGEALTRHEEGPDHPVRDQQGKDRKSTRLNSSHGSISYAVFC